MSEGAAQTSALPPIELLVHGLPPTGAQWLQVASGAYIVAMVLATLAVIAVLLLGGVHLLYIYWYISNESIVGVCSLLAMYMPRCALFMFTICLTYLMVCLKMVVGLICNLFGTRKAFSDYLRDNNQRIFLNAPPFCCCCKCCPTFRATVRNIQYTECLVIQSPFLRIFLEIILFIAFLEGSTTQALVVTVSILEAISMAVATWGCQILTLLSKEQLKDYCFGTIFQLVNTTQVFFTLQKLVFDLIGQFHGFGSEDVLSHVFKAFFWNNFLLCLEMLLLSIMASVLVSPKRCALFDMHRYQKDYCVQNISPATT